MPEYIINSYQKYREKICDAGRCTTSVPPVSESVWAFVGCFCGIGIVTYLTYLKGVPVLVASLGASACLIYGVPAAPFAQPRNAIAGHLLAAVVGVMIYQLLGNFWYTAASSVGIAVALMVATRTVHPPAGATALIGVITQQSWLFPLLPVGIGICILVLVGILVNNMALNRKYPTYWW